MTMTATATAPATDRFSHAKAELEFAYERVPFYKDHLESAGLTPQSVRGPEDFRHVPPTRKADYRRHFPMGVLARGKTLKDPEVLLPRSSGRTGERLVTARYVRDTEQRLARTLSVNQPALARAMSRRRDPICMYGPPACSDVDCANPLRSMSERTLPNGILALPVAHDLTMTPARMLNQAIDEIGAFGATTLIVAGAHVSFLLRAYAARNVPPPPMRLGLATFTPLTELSRAHWRAFFGRAPIVNLFDMTEFGSIGAECPAGRMHINSESYYPELMRDDGLPAAPGDLAELYVTSIGDRLCPHVRYATGDFFRVLDGCACGSTWPAVSMEGRRVDFLSRHDGTPITPGQVSAAVGAPAGVDLYQVVQDSKRHLQVGLLTNASYRQTTAAELVERLRDLFGDLPVRVEPESYLPSERSGKFLHCRSEAAHS